MSSTPVAETTTPASAPNATLLRRFREHVEGERERVEAYVDLARSSPEYVGHLVQLIFEDGARNHRLFVEMINRIRSDIDGGEHQPRLPSRGNTSDSPAQLAEMIQRLIDLEAEDEAALEALHEDLGPRRDTTLLSLVLELKQLDAKKHIMILESIRSHLELVPASPRPMALDLRVRA